MNDTIGSRISHCRKSLGLSQEALGEKMGVSRQAVNKWESDAAIPEIDKLIALSRLFGVSIGWLLGVEEAPQETPEQDDTLKAIEELLKREPPAQPKWQKPLLILTALCSILSLILSLAAAWRTGTNRAMIYTLNSQTSLLSSQYSDLYGQLGTQGTTQEQTIPTDRLLENAQFRITPKKDMNEAVVSFYGLPRTHTEGETAELVVYQDGTTVQEQIQPGIDVPSDLEEQLTFVCASRYDQITISRGQVELHDYWLELTLPPALQKMDSLQWESLELVLYRNGQEIARESLTAYEENIAGGKWGWSDLTFPIDTFETGDELKLCVEGSLSGYVLNHTDRIWEMTESGQIQLTYAGTTLVE